MPGEKQQISVSFNTGRWRFRGGSTKGGTGFGGPQRGGSSTEVTTDAPELTNAELVQLRVRVIALENLAIALLAGASDRQLDLAHEMAAYISPRPGFTQHSLLSTRRPR